MPTSTQLAFRAPGSSLPLEQLLSRALPELGAEAAEELLARGAVQVGARRRPGLATRVAPGTLVRVDCDTDVDAGDSLGSAGAWLALVPALPWRGAAFEPTRKLPGGLRFERGAVRDGLSELRLEGDPLELHRVLAKLSALGFAVVGDVAHGGILCAGGLRLREAQSEEPADWWPAEPALLGTADGEPGAIVPFAVSEATHRALARSHPWVLRDAETDDAARFAAGALVRLHDDLLARVEDSGRVAARVWWRGEQRPQPLADRVARALERRRSLLKPMPEAAVTNAFRLIHGEADGLPGIAVDRLGPLLRVLISGRAAETIREPVVDAVRAALRGEIGSEAPVVEVVHLRDRPAGRFECVRLVAGRREGWESLFERSESGRLTVVERGLRFAVDPGLAQPHKPSPGTGLYLDQRENRARLAVHARRGGRWLNLFAHTGAFSLALLDAGADEVVSVDLSARVLRWLEANLAGNPGLDAARHQSVCADGRRHLEKQRGRFAGIVIDPPTAAAGGRGYWKLERDLPPLLEQALARLEPGGTLFVSRNDRRRREPATELVRRAGERSGVALRSVESAPPGVDFPRLSGFPEGDAFDAAIARLP